LPGLFHGTDRGIPQTNAGYLHPYHPGLAASTYKLQNDKIVIKIANIMIFNVLKQAYTDTIMYDNRNSPSDNTARMLRKTLRRTL
jgi:hypothetical protein